jgi:glycosyltransferase involved in cell wall biosynthesis
MFVTIVIPVYNEERSLPLTIPQLHQFVTEHCRFDFEIVIGDNASRDNTLAAAHELACRFESVRVEHLDQKGRGRMLAHVWSESDADVLTYMDVDLSTDLCALPFVVEALASGGFDVAVGSRLLSPGDTTRGFKREVISRCYNLLIKLAFRTRFSDAQCGFKALRRDAAQFLLPMIRDTNWFFDTELLILAEKLGFRILDAPVTWVDDPDSRVDIVRTAWEDIKGLARLKRGFINHNYQMPIPVGLRARDRINGLHQRSVKWYCCGR